MSRGSGPARSQHPSRQKRVKDGPIPHRETHWARARLPFAKGPFLTRGILIFQLCHHAGLIWLPLDVTHSFSDVSPSGDGLTPSCPDPGPPIWSVAKSSRNAVFQLAEMPTSAREVLDRLAPSHPDGGDAAQQVDGQRASFLPHVRSVTWGLSASCPSQRQNHKAFLNWGAKTRPTF